MRKLKPLIALAISFGIAGTAAATSIFSYHPRGFGYPAWQGDGRSMGMGGASVALYDLSSPVSLNPAVLGGFSMTSMTATFLNQKRMVQDYGGLRGKFYDQYPRILRVVVPLGYGVVTSVGLEPISDVRMIWSNRTIADGITFQDSLESSGGLWAASLQFAREFRQFSAGIRLQLVRGSIMTEWRRTILDPAAPLATSALVTRRLTGVVFGLGGIYRITSDWTLGAVLDVPGQLDEVETSSLGTRIPSTVYPQHEDKSTAVAPDRADTTSTGRDFPWSATLGAAWKPIPNLVTVGEIGYQRWSRLSPDFRSTWRLALGVEARPSTDFKSFFLLQWPYRAGVRWEQHYIPTRDATDRITYPNGWFLSTGLGVPIGDGLGQIDCSFEYGRRGSVGVNLARETIWRQTISVVGWERWFARRPRR